MCIQKVQAGTKRVCHGKSQQGVHQERLLIREQTQTRILALDDKTKQARRNKIVN